MIRTETPLTLDEYRQATDDVRLMASRLVESQRRALSKQISKLSTLNGKIEQAETAKAEAADLVESTTRAYAAVVLAEALTRWNDAPGIGARRLEEATAERTPSTSKKKTPSTRSVPRIAKQAEPARHGTDRRYRAGCSCSICRKAHAATQAQYRAKRKRKTDREATRRHLHALPDAA